MWNYRAVEKTNRGKTFYEVHEVYYDENGEIFAYSQDPQSPFGETHGELIKDLSMMLKDVKHTAPITLETLEKACQSSVETSTQPS